MTTKTIDQLVQIDTVTANDQFIVRDPEETTFAKTKYASATQVANFIIAGAADAGLQPSDGDLTAISALTGSGIAVRTGTDAWALRQIGQPAAGITVSDATGAGGDPTLALANDLAALEGLSGTGLARRTGADTWSVGTTVATAEIADDAVTYAKLQNISATDRLLGRDTSGAGNTEEITVSGGVEFTGSGGIQRSALTGDVTASAGSNATTIANDAVTLAKMQNIATSSILGRVTASTGDIEVLTGSQAGGLIALDDLSDLSVTTPTDGYVLTWDNSNGVWIAAEAPGAGSGAPSDAQYITLATHASLSAERTLVAGVALKLTDAGANGNATVDVDITELTEDSTPDIANDFLISYDASATAHKKVKPTNLPVSATNISTGTLPDARLSSAATPYGKQCIWIPSAAMFARSTNGAASGSVEMTTNKNMFKTLDFDTSTQEFAQFAIGMPASWNEGTVTFKPVWSHPSTVTNFGAVFSLAGVAISDDDAGDVAFGTAQTSTDTGGTTNDIYKGPESSAITVAGTPAAGDYVMFQVARVPADGSDTLAVDARLHGIELYITTDAGHD